MKQIIILFNLVLLLCVNSFSKCINDINQIKKTDITLVHNQYLDSYVGLNISRSEISLELPLFFTPNADGVNDLFTPIISVGIRITLTTIYDTDGNKIFETNNPLIEWDGGSATDGLYHWVVNYVDNNSDKKHQMRGHVTVLK